jgi:hypothetical protein
MTAASNSSGPTASSNGAGTTIFGAVGMWSKRIIAVIGEIIEIEWQSSGTSAGCKTWLLVRLPAPQMPDAPTRVAVKSTPAPTGNAEAVNTNLTN